jgi:PAS domain S-box-containing protein
MPDINRLSRQALHAAFLHSPVGIGVCDEDGRFLTISRSLARLLRRAPEAIIGRPFLTFVHPDARAVGLAAYFEAVVAAAAGVRGGNTTLRCLAGNGQSLTLDVSWTITEPDETGRRYGVLYLTDTTTGIATTRGVDTTRGFDIAYGIDMR